MQRPIEPAPASRNQAASSSKTQRFSICENDDEADDSGGFDGRDTRPPHNSHSQRRVESPGENNADGESSTSAREKPKVKLKEAESITLSPLPKVPYIRSWKLALQYDVASASGDPERGFELIQGIDNFKLTLEQLYDSDGKVTLGAKLAAAVTKVLAGERSRRINIEKERLTQKGASDERTTNPEAHLRALSDL